MRARDILTESNLAAKILQDPKTAKMVSIAIRHDQTLPKNDIVALGPRPTDQQIIGVLGSLVDQVLSDSNFGNLSKDGKLDSWIIKQYANHLVDFEELAGETVDSLGAWKALSVRGLLNPAHQDLNNFQSAYQLRQTMEATAYRTAIANIKKAEMLEKHKRSRQEVILIDNERFLVFIPMNYGSCYTFNFQTGHQSNFCTGGSDGLRWFQRYADEGPVVSIIDKSNANNKNGKWQMHAPTDQLKNSTQDQYGNKASDIEFNTRFPGLMKLIIAAMQAKAAEIQAASTHIVDPDGYNVGEAISEIANKFPLSASGKKPTKQDIERIRLMDQEDALDQQRVNVAGLGIDAGDNAAPAAQVNDTPADWYLHYGLRTFPGSFLQNATAAQAKQVLQKLVRDKRMVPGRAWAASDDAQERIVRP